jgi:hypothetical protein
VNWSVVIPLYTAGWCYSTNVNALADGVITVSELIGGALVCLDRL